MEKQPFTPSGVQQKQDELYALPNAQLEEQVQLIEDNLLEWIADNFTLTAEQQTFLDQIGEAMIQFLTDSISYAVAHRLPIVLVRPDDGQPQPRGTKIFKPENKLTATTHGGDTFKAGGELILHVSYGS